MKITQAKFGFDGNLKAAMYYKILQGLDEEKGKFHVGFSLIQYQGTVMLVAFRDTVSNIIGVADCLVMKEWLQAVVSDKGYRSELTYYSDIEPLGKGNNSPLAMKIPIDVSQWTEVPNIKEFEQMLSILHKEEMAS